MDPLLAIVVLVVSLSVSGIFVLFVGTVVGERVMQKWGNRPLAVSVMCGSIASIGFVGLKLIQWLPNEIVRWLGPVANGVAATLFCSVGLGIMCSIVWGIAALGGVESEYDTLVPEESV